MVTDTCPGRSDSWEVLQSQVKAAQNTGSFYFTHRKLDNVTAFALAQYLRQDCRAKFVDLSGLGEWKIYAPDLASVVEGSLRSARSLVLDGNDMGSDVQVLERWCVALEQHPGLQHISLRDSCIDDKALERLAEMVRCNILLFSIDIGFNRISDQGVQLLIDAIDDNQVLLEVILDGCDVSNDMQARLSVALQHNRDRFPNPSGCLSGLRNLRRARADATTALSIRACSVHDSKLATKDSVCDSMLMHEAPKEMTSALLSMYAAMEPDEIPFIPDNEVDEECDGVFFDAGSGPMTELNNRCEAGWRYNASDREVLCELRRTTTDIKACRKHERKRGDEAVDRIASSQKSFREQLSPMEQHILELKEELASEMQAQERNFKVNIAQKIALRAAQEELEEAQGVQCRHFLGLQSLENGLMLRNREVQEQVERLQSELANLEQTTECLSEDNERCRRLLHAARFETETERFIPRAAREQAAAHEAAEHEARVRAANEAAKQAEGAPPPAPPLEFFTG